METQGDGGVPANPYILSFAGRAADFVKDVARSSGVDTGLRTVWIWNEPQLKTNDRHENQDCSSASQWGDDGDNSLAPEIFGSLVQRTATAIKASLAQAGISGISLYCGSLSVLKSFDPTGANAAGYLDRMYGYLNEHGVGPTATPYAWDGMSLNLNGADVDAAFVNSVWDQMNHVRAQVYGDSSPLIVGEWGSGFVNEDSQITRPEAQVIFDAIRARFITMYFYSHHRSVERPGAGPQLTFGARQYAIGAAPPGTTIPIYVATTPFDWYGHLVYLYQLPGVD